MQDNATNKKRTVPRWEKAFLSVLRLTGIVSRAAESVQIDPSVIYKHRKHCSEFRQEWEEALQDSATLLEDEAVRRAREGLIKYKFKKSGDPLYFPGTTTPYFEHEYSDILLMFLLKGILPEKYGSNARDIQEMRKELEEIKKALHVDSQGDETGHSGDQEESPPE